MKAEEIRDLRIAVKQEYFDQILRGEKAEEYRKYNDYWKKRLCNPLIRYRNVIITAGYPKRGDSSREISFPYMGWERKTIVHKHFDLIPTNVFAIKLTRIQEDEK